MLDPGPRRDLAASLTVALSIDSALLPQAPRPYQREALVRIRDWLDDPSGSDRAHVVHATGLGKTVLFSLLAHAAPGLRILVVVPTLVLLEQTVRALTKAVGGMIGQVSSYPSVKDGHGEIVATRGHRHHDIVVTTNSSLSSRSHELIDGFRPHLVVWDECHTSYSGLYGRVRDRFVGTPILAFTATPDYLAAVKLPGLQEIRCENGDVGYGLPKYFAATHFGTLLDRRSLRWGIENRWLAPLAWDYVDLEDDLESVPIINSTEAGFDYKLVALQQAMCLQWDAVTAKIVGLYANGAHDLPSRQVFAACPSIDTAEALASALRRTGVAAACVSSRNTKEERRQSLDAFAAGAITFLSSVIVLREGWDAPNAEVCMMLRPTKSRLLYEQYLGRAMRLLPDGRPKTALVLDVFRRQSAFGPLNAPRLFGNGAPIERGSTLIPHLPLATEAA